MPGQTDSWATHGVVDAVKRTSDLVCDGLHVDPTPSYSETRGRRPPEAALDPLVSPHPRDLTYGNSTSDKEETGPRRLRKCDASSSLCS